MKKRVLSAFLVFCMVLSLLPVPAHAAEVVATGECGAQGDNITWILGDDGELSINGKGEMVDYIGGEEWFDYREQIRTVSIDNGVTSIGGSAFFECSGLISVDIPESVTSIGDAAFASCSSLTRVIIPDGVTSIADSTFHSCSSLTNVNIPDSVTGIGEVAFRGCSSLTSVAIPGSVSRIARGAFWECSGLTNMTIPASVTSIEEGTFWGCSSLTSMIIPENVTSIGQTAFSGCSNLINVTIGNNATSIGSGAFYECGSLADVYYSGTKSQWEAIKIEAYNDPLYNVTIHCTDGDITPVGSDPAEPDDSDIVASGECGDDITWYLQGNGTLLLRGNGETYNYGGYWFQPPAPWDYLSDHITSIQVQGNITYLGSALFESCTNAKRITLSGSIEDIFIDALPRYGVCQYISVEPDGNGNYVDDGAALYAKGAERYDGKYALVYYPPARQSEKYTLDTKTEVIAGRSFSRNPYLKEVTLNQNLTVIGYSAFEGCSNLQKINIPYGVEKIQDSAFEDCSSLTNISLPESLVSLSPSAFWFCDSLKRIVVPASVTELDTGISMAEGFSAAPNEYKEWYFLGDAPKMTEGYESIDSFGWVDKDYCLISTWIYYPQSASGWLEFIENYGASDEFVEFIAVGEDKTGYTYKITSPLGSMDKETGYYAVDSEHNWSFGADAPVYALAGVYIDGEELVKGTDYETVENPGDDDFELGVTIYGTYFYANLSTGLHTLAAEFIEETNSGNQTYRATQNFVIWPSNPTVLEDGYVGMPYSYQINESWTHYELWNNDNVVRLPDGLTLNQSTGLISGTPAKAGTWYFYVEGSTPGAGTDGSVPREGVEQVDINSGVQPFAAGGGAQPYKLTIQEASAIPKLTDGVKYVPYSIRAEEKDFTETPDDPGWELLHYELVGKLPLGLEFDTSTATIYGVPLEYGTWDFQVRRILPHPEEGDDAASVLVMPWALTVLNNDNAAVQRPNDYDIIEYVGTRDPNDPNSFLITEYRDEEFIIDGPYEEFYCLYIDGVLRTRDVDYTVREGSTVITIRSQTFRNVGEGTHTIAAEFRSTDTNGKTTVKTVAQNYTLTINRPGNNTGGAKPGTSNSDSSSTSYSITVPKIPNCTVKVTPTSASANAKVTLTVKPNAGYKLASLTVTGPKGEQIALTQTDEYKYTFRMPNGNVNISAQAEKEQPAVPAGDTPFVDMLVTDWFYQSVAAAYERGWMAGTSAITFEPYTVTSRGMFVTVLHRIAGEPAAENSSYYSDVPPNQYYAPAAAWAAEQGIVNGYGDGRFGPSDDLTREQIVMILYNYANLTGMDTSARNELAQFIDLDKLSSGAQTAMSWANSVGLVSGKGNGILDPAGSATRAEMAALLVRFVDIRNIFSP